MNKYRIEFERLKAEGKNPKWEDVVPADEIQAFRAEMLKSLHISPAKTGVRGLGDVIHTVTDFLGIPECGGCAERREKLNEMFPFGSGDKTE